jgi:D-sedoheptulose 7-phosphate isomerase
MEPERLQAIVAESLALKQRFFAQNATLIRDTGLRIAACLRAGGKVLTFGNGGSAADAQHLAGELVVRFLKERSGLSALALTTDASVLTATANDLGFESVFKRQVEAHGRAGDVAIGLTTSGRSPNVTEALREAHARGLVTVGITGRGGGEIASLADYLLDVPHDSTARIQEVHGMIVHLLCEIIEEAATA